jgi:DNA-binding FadR family transcriptional regulator
MHRRALQAHENRIGIAMIVVVADRKTTGIVAVIKYRAVPNAFTYVANLSFEANEKIFKVRRVLETYAVEEAARNATPEQIRSLERAYREMMDTARARDLEIFILHVYAVHQ